MTWLVLVVLAVLAVALYPIIRDFLRQRRHSQPAYVEGLQLLLDGRPDAALKALKEAVEADTDNVDAYIRLGDIYFARGDTERGLRLHESLALRRNLKPEDERRVFSALARDYLRIGRRVKALAMLEELARVDRNDWECREQLAELYVETASWDKCEAILREFRRHPQHHARAARLLLKIGRARTGEPSAARAALEEALRLDPSLVEARIALGDLELESGNTEAAIRTWTKVIEAAPERNAAVRSRLERAYFDSGRYEDIITLYEQLLRRLPNNTDIAVTLAGIYRKKGELATAARLLEPLAGSRDPLPILMLALVRTEQNDPRARNLLEAAIAQLQSAPTD